MLAVFCGIKTYHVNFDSKIAKNILKKLLRKSYIS